MTQLGFEFHATPAELAHLVEKCVEGLDLQLAAEVFSPEFKVLALEGSSLADQISKLKRVDRISISQAMIDTNAATSYEFHMKNPERLTILVGPPDPAGLRESNIGTISQDRQALATWRKIVRRADRSMHRGSYVVNPANGARQEDRSHRYTDGALAMFESGTAMLGSGWLRYEFGNPDELRASDN